MATAAGVVVTTEVDAWPGDADILQDVTPVKVTILNHSEVPLRIQYRQFALRTGDGTLFPALPPYRIEGTITEPVAVLEYDPVAPGFLYEGFAVDPVYADAYPAISPYGYGIERDLDYYNTYYARWRKPLPTQEMVTRAMPEGVLEPGGKLSGFLYFERVDDDLGLVHFRGRLVDATDGSVFGAVQIPMLTTETNE